MVRRPGSIKLAEIAGIRIGVDVSWFFVLFLVIYVLSVQFKDILSASDGVAYLTAVASALLFFGSIVLHELGHAWASRRQGVEVTRIDLWFFGGLATRSRDSATPAEELKVAAAGPVVTLLVAAVCLGLGWALAGGSKIWHSATLSGDSIAPALLLLGWLGTINAVLLLFNLLPALPLDGGRIARALIWKRTGDKLRATRAAARLGQILGWLVGAGGILLVGLGDLQGLWLIAMAFFFGQASRAAVVQSVFTEKIEGVRVADIMDPEPVSVPDDFSLDRAHDEYFLRYRWSSFPVVDDLGRFVGLIGEDQARDGGTLTVGAVVERADDRSIGAEEPLEALIASEPLRRFGSLMAVDRDGTLRGVVTIEQLRRALANAFSPGTR
ncbi:MAG: peptidase [Solirubrobacterales bacterium]|jgi:Zn-dependent protease|nr:peptidase [Solirubrobacterales bacterium]